MSYIVDVYRDKVPVQKNMISFGAYVTMFPQLVAVRSSSMAIIARQLVSRTMTLDRFGEGAELFIRGLAKKVLLANKYRLAVDEREGGAGRRAKRIVGLAWHYRLYVPDLFRF